MWYLNWQDYSSVDMAMDHWVGGTLWKHLLFWHKSWNLRKSADSAFYAAAARWANKELYAAWAVYRQRVAKLSQDEMRLRRAAFRWMAKELGAALSVWTAYLAAVWRSKNRTLKALRLVSSMCSVSCMSRR